MKQKAFHFGPGKSLAGIIGEPDTPADQQLPAVILLNSGLIHRAGPNRIYVRLCRALAARGYTTLRFDFSGVGDSQLKLDSRSYEDRSIAEARAAMDFLQKARGINTFVLSGICAGADIAFHSACRDERVAGIIPIDLYTIPNNAYLMKLYRKRLLQPRSWLNLISGKSDILKSIRNKVWSLLTASKSESPAAETADTSSGSIQKIIEGFQTLHEQKLPIFLVYSDGSPAYFNYQRNFISYAKQLSADGLLQLEFIEYSDHGFTLLHHQELLEQAVCEWLAKIFNG